MENKEIEEFKRLIKSTGLKKEKIAEINGSHTTTITNMLAGKTKIPPLLLEKLNKLDKKINSSKL